MNKPQIGNCFFFWLLRSFKWYSQKKKRRFKWENRPLIWKMLNQKKKKKEKKSENTIGLSENNHLEKVKVQSIASSTISLWIWVKREKLPLEESFFWWLGVYLWWFVDYVIVHKMIYAFKKNKFFFSNCFVCFFIDHININVFSWI